MNLRLPRDLRTLSAAYVAEVLAAMEIEPAPLRDALAESGLGSGWLAQPSARVTEQQFGVLYRRLAVCCDDEMPHLFSRPLRPGALKFTCLSLLEARDLQTALHRWTMVLRLLQDDFRLEVSRDAGRGCIAIVEEPGRRPCKPVALDLMLKLIHGVASWLIDRRIPLERVDFSFPAPASAVEYDLLYPGPVSYGEARSALHVDADYFDHPIRRGRADLRPFLLRAPQDWLFVPFREPRLEQRVREYMASRLPAPTTGETAARAFHLSMRTLHRRLANEGTSLQQVKDRLRRDLAIHRLSATQEDIAAIAAQLGFDGPASFHRAFKAWTGTTPGVYRSRSGRA